MLSDRSVDQWLAMVIEAPRGTPGRTEQLLQRDLPGYVAYSQHTKKLIPFVC
jgi:hypothetical protein